MRRPAAKGTKPRKAQPISFPTPSAGLISNRNIALPQGQAPGAAMLENWFPTPQSTRLRRGMVRRATLPGNTPTRSLFTYINGVTEELYAANDAGIWDVSTVQSAYSQIISPSPGFIIGPEAGYAIGWDSVDPDDVTWTSTNGYWSTVQYSTAGGSFLIGVNGSDEGFIYDGTDWDALGVTFPSPSTLTTADLAFVWVYKNRIYFIEKNTLNVWYLPVDQIGGELTLLPMGGIFSRGGNLLFGQSWSLSSGGDGGLSEQCVFVTTEGEVAVFQGLSPDPNQGWEKVGVYRAGKPLGQRAWIKAGGDLVIATSIGFIPLSKAIDTDYAALGLIAVSNPISDEWRQAVQQRGVDGWHCELWAEGSMTIIGTPTPDDLQPLTLIVNADSGAWCRFTNWQPFGMETFRGKLFMGSTNGRVQEAWVGGSDEGRPYTATALPLFYDSGTPFQRKIARNAKVTIRSSYPVNPRVTAKFDWDMNMPPAPSASLIPVGNEWDNGIWDESIWNAEPGAFLWQNNVSVGGSGYAASVAVQITSSSLVPLDAELVRLDLTTETADVVS